MSAHEIVRSMIQYHLALTQQVWESIDKIGDEQFLAEEDYSRGSIRNLMVHIASTDRRWLAGLKKLPDVGHVKFEAYPDRRSARELFEQVAKDLSDNVNGLSESELEENLDLPVPTWQVLLHLVNHGTDHRATVLQRLQILGAPTFDQDYILWSMKK